MTDTDYKDDLALLANSVAKAEYLLHSLEWAAEIISQNVNRKRTEFIDFKQRETSPL